MIPGWAALCVCSGMALCLISGSVMAGSRDPSVDPLFYSIAPEKSEALEQSLDAYIGDQDGDGHKYRTACRVKGGQVLEFSNVLGGNFIKNELSKDDVWKAIGNNPKAMTKVMRALKKARKTPNIDLPYGVDVMLAYAAQPDGQVKFWGIGPGYDTFFQVKSKGESVEDIAGSICEIINKFGLNHQ